MARSRNHRCCGNATVLFIVVSVDVAVDKVKVLSIDVEMQLDSCRAVNSNKY